MPGFLVGLVRGFLRAIPLILLMLPVAELLLDLWLFREYGGAFMLYLAVATVVGLWLIVRAKSSLLAGLATLRQSTLAAGAQLNASALLGYFLASARAFFAGLLLLFPGALSDLLALLVVLLPGRVVAPTAPPPPDDGVIEGEFREIPDDPARLR